MSRFGSYLKESIHDRKIYRVKSKGAYTSEIWLAYDPGNGQTIPYGKDYVTDKNGEKNFDPAVTMKLVEYAKRNKPMKANKDKSVRMYELPVYDSFDQKTYDIWGGDRKPVAKEYFIVSMGEINVVNFFTSKNEALGWMRSTV